MTQRHATLHAGVALAALLWVPAPASAATMTFDAVATPGELLIDPYFEDGIKMELILGHYDLIPGGGDGGSPWALIDDFSTGPTSTIRFSMADGSPFTLNSAFVVDDVGVNLFGTFTFFDGASSWSWTPSAFGTASFGYTGLLYFEYTITDQSDGVDHAGIDTISVTAATVPEPATLLLLGTGLGAVAARRRLKKRT